MWRSLLIALGVIRPWKPRPYRSINFIRTLKNHWAKFDGGDNYDARFIVRGEKVAYGDTLLVRMQSGRIGRYRVFSVQHDYTGRADWQVHATGLGYMWEAPPVPQPLLLPAPKIAGLLTDGSRWVRSNTGELAHLPRGFTKPASEFWKIFTRDEANCNRPDSMRTTSNL
jgi:hypothetical protein